MTAVKASDVDRAVKSRSAQICVLLFYGPDSGRVAERAKQAAESGVTDPSDPFQLVRLDGEALLDHPGKLVEEATTYGMFGDRRAILVRPTSRNIAGAVSACLEAAPDGTLVVIEAGELSKTSPLRVACEKSPRALALPCYSDETKDLGSVVAEALRAEGLSIDRDASELLIDSLGGDRLASRGEIAKLALYCLGQEKVTVEDVHAVVSDVSGLSIDAALDAAFGGNPDDLEPSLRHLSANGIAPAQLLALALRHALALLSARTSMDSGADPDSALRSWRGLSYTRKGAVTRQLSRWSSANLTRAVAILQEVTLETRLHASLAQPLTTAALMRIASRGRAGARG